MPTPSPTPSIVCLLLLIALLWSLRGPRIGALAGLLHAWWLAPAGVVTPCIALGIILLAPQMPDMFAGMADGADGLGWWRLGRGLGCASGVLGLASWYWTRAGLNAEAGKDDRDAPYDPALAPAGAAPPFWEWFKAGYHQAPRWAALPAALMAISPPLLAWLHPALHLQPQFIAAAVSLAIFCASLLPFTIYRRAHVAAALVPLALWFVLMLTMADGTRLCWIRLAMVTALLVLAYVAQRHDWVPKHIPAWAWRYPPLGLIAGAPLGWPVGLLVLAAAAAACFASDTWPWIVAASFQAPSVALVALGLIVGPFAVGLSLCRALAFPWGTWAALPGGRTAKLLIGTAGFLWLVFATPVWIEQWLSPNLYEIRAAGTLPSRPGLQEALARWRTAQIDICEHPREAPLPVIVAAAEGGASRAAVWFLSAAAMLEDDNYTAGRFGQYLFAISGVSGGSLGAVTYLQALKADRANGGSPCRGPRPATLAAGIGTMVDSDPLAPALAGFFLNDALMRLLPMHRLWSGYNDRAVMLEYAFQRDWAGWWPRSEAEEGRAASRESFVSLRRDLGDLAPHLFLNGTDVDNGRRLITSTVAFGRAVKEYPEAVFPLAEDLLQRFGHDVPAATAVTNSARFPLLSPPGRIPGRQVIDGGYFDNYGSRTADDLVLEIERIGKANGWNLVPIVVLVTNDADTAADDLPRYAVSCEQLFPLLPDAGAPSDSAEDARDEAKADALKQHQALAARGEAARSPTIEGGAPVLGLIATRGAHGVDGLQILRRRLCDPNDPGSNRLIHIALPRPGAGDAAPMNWVLNEAAGQFMRDEAPKTAFNEHQAGLLARMLPRTAGGSGGRRWDDTRMDGARWKPAAVE
jgi:hypothetical protein